MKVIDASGLVVGRMASYIAKWLLMKERIIVVNAEEAVVSGKRLSSIREMKKFLEVGSPKYGPRHPRRPDAMLRRVIRGMLPWDKPRGREAYKRLKVFVGFPKELRDKPVETIPKASFKSKLQSSYIKLGELAREIGWRTEGK